MTDMGQPGQVKVSITNTYSDGHESEVEVFVDPPEGGVPTEDWWEDEVFPHTGDGHGAKHPKLGVSYEATIVGIVGYPNDTGLCGLTNEWDG